MIGDFEQRFATVLGSRLPAPFAGQVQVGENGNQNQPRVVVGVQMATPLQPDFGNRRPEIAPGSATFRRIMRLRCIVGVEFRPGNNSTRDELVAGLDAALYALDAPDIRDGSAFPGPASDPGFLLECADVSVAHAPLDLDDEADPVGLSITVEGWFWPAGTPGEAGVAIGEIRVRGVVLPLILSPAVPQLTAGGPPQPLSLAFQSRGRHRVADPMPDPPVLPFGSLVVNLEAEAGGPGAGTLNGGTAAVGGGRLVPVEGDAVIVTYTPPAGPTRDTVVVALDDGQDGAGLELARYVLEVFAS